MIRTPLIAILLSGVGTAVCAQSANEPIKSLESCFESARAADAVCFSPTKDAPRRLDCLQKARDAQLDCLKYVALQPSAGPAPSEKAGTLDAPNEAASPELANVAPDHSVAAVLPNKPAAAASSDAAAAASPDTSATIASSDKPAAAASTGLPVGPADKPTVAVSSDKPAASPEKPTTPNPPSKIVDLPPKPPVTRWVISETTSPVDFTPMTTAAIRVPVGTRHAPDTLAIRCRGKGTELLVRTGGSWRTSRADEVQVEYRINDHPPVRLPWTISADGRTASYKEDSIKLLASLPDGAQLKISVFNGTAPRFETIFPLAGLDAAREKIAAVCKWAAAPNKMSSGNDKPGMAELNFRRHGQ